MALVVFVRGVNVGGRRRFRPSELVGTLRAYDLVNVGAAGTFVVRKPGPRAEFLAEFRRRVPFGAMVAWCEGGELVRLWREKVFGAEPAAPGEVRFVSILAEAGDGPVSFPVEFPDEGEWLVRILGRKQRLVYGVYRRHMRTIGALERIDRLFGAPATTRSWGTIVSVLRVLGHQGQDGGGGC